MVLNPLDLSQTNGGGDIGHAVVVADDREPIAAGRIHSLAPEQAEFVCQRPIVGRHHTALAGGDDLVAEKAECRTITNRTDRTAAILGTDGLSCILQNEQPMLLREFEDRVHVCGVSVEVDGDDPLCPRCDLLRDIRRIEIECSAVVIDKNRRSAAISNSIRARDISQCRNDDLVTGLDTKSSQGQMEGSRTIISRHRVVDAAKRRESILESFNEAAVRRDPVRLQTLHHVLGFPAIENRTGHRNPGLGSGSGNIGRSGVRAQGRHGLVLEF